MGGVTVMAGGSIPHKQRLRADDRLASVVTGCRATRRTFRSAPGACGAALGPSSRGAPWPEPGLGRLSQVARTPEYRTTWILGGGIMVASRQSKERGSMSTAYVPSRKGLLRVMRTRPSGSKLRRSWARGGRSTYLHKASRPGASSAPAWVAACSENPNSVTERGAVTSTPGWPRNATGSGRRRSSGPDTVAKTPSTKMAYRCGLSFRSALFHCTTITAPLQPSRIPSARMRGRRTPALASRQALTTGGRYTRSCRHCIENRGTCSPRAQSCPTTW